MQKIRYTEVNQRQHGGVAQRLSFRLLTGRLQVRILSPSPNMGMWLNWQSSRLLTGRLQVRLLSSPPNMGMWLNWQSSRLLTGRLQVRFLSSPPKKDKNRTLKIPYLNHAYDQLDEQSVPALRGMGYFQYDPARIPAGENCCRPVMTGGKTETVNKRSCRRTVRIKSYSPSGRNNRRPD